MSSSASSSAPVVVWRFRDGKPGHENQSAGLLQALAELVSLEVHDIAPEGGVAALWHWLLGRFPAGQGLPAPALLVGAGHATHLPMLAARRARGGRILVLMKPSLPGGWFDLCLIPRHDDPRPSPRVMITEGVLNRVRPAADKDPGLGLVLIGGPSRHHGWDGDALADHLGQLLARDPVRHWRLTTSRRTPPGWLARLAPLVERSAGRLELVPWEQTGPDWLPEQLARAAVVWVTEDSVSMVYEALTAGGTVGLLPMPAKGAGRIGRGLERLREERRVVDFANWLRQGEYPVPRPFDEARRCAQWIRDRWLSAR